MKAQPVMVEQLASEDFELKASVNTLKVDIETSPYKGYFWGKKWQTNISEITDDSYIMSFSAIVGGKQITKALPDYPDYEKNKRCDKAICRDLYDLFEKADIIVAHNGDRFDIRRIEGRFLIHGFLPTHKYVSRDTMKMYKKRFDYPSNSLNDIVKRHGLGSKIETNFSLWTDCTEKDDPKAWRLMKRYNAHDTRLLEAVYEMLRPWDRQHPNVNAILGRPAGCNVCENVQMRRTGYTYTKTGRKAEYRCTACGSCAYGPHEQRTLIR